MKVLGIVNTILAAAALVVACLAYARADKAHRLADVVGDALQDTIRAVHIINRK